MFTRILSIAAVALVAACSQQQLVDARVASSLNVVDVQVDAATASNKGTRGFNLSEEQAETIFDQAITAELQKRARGQTAARADVAIQSIFIPNALAGAIFGSNYPSATALVQLRDAQSGSPIGEAMTISVGGGKAAGGQLRPGIIGAAMQQGEATEFRNLAAGLAAQISAAIYGEQS